MRLLSAMREYPDGIGQIQFLNWSESKHASCNRFKLKQLEESFWKKNDYGQLNEWRNRATQMNENVNFNIKLSCTSFVIQHFYMIRIYTWLSLVEYSLQLCRCVLRCWSTATYPIGSGLRIRSPFNSRSYYYHHHRSSLSTSSSAALLLLFSSSFLLITCLLYICEWIT